MLDQDLFSEARAGGNESELGSSYVARLYWALIVCLVAISALGAARERRVSALSAPILIGIPTERRLVNALEITRRVAERFRYIEEHGPAGDVAPWPLRTDADYLLTGGDCGQAAEAISAIFISRRQPFRIIQVNLGEAGASHIMIETQDDAQRWVLIDPIEGHGFPRPLDGRLLGIEEIQALPTDERAWLAEIYREGDWSLFTPYRRTNWTRLGWLSDVVREIEGDERMQNISLRAVMLEADGRLADGAEVTLILLAIVGMLARRSSWSKAN